MRPGLFMSDRGLGLLAGQGCALCKPSKLCFQPLNRRAKNCDFFCQRSILIFNDRKFPRQVEANAQQEDDAEGKEEVGRDLHAHKLADAGKEVGKPGEDKGTGSDNEPKRRVFLTERCSADQFQNYSDHY